MLFCAIDCEKLFDNENLRIISHSISSFFCLDNRSSSLSYVKMYGRWVSYQKKSFHDRSINLHLHSSYLSDKMINIMQKKSSCNLATIVFLLFVSHCITFTRWDIWWYGTYNQLKMVRGIALRQENLLPMTDHLTLSIWYMFFGKLNFSSVGVHQPAASRLFAVIL